MKELLLKKRNRIIPFGICAIYAILTIIYHHTAFEVNDDEAMNLIAVGAYGESVSQYLVFQSVLYGYIVRAFMLFFPEFNWYLVGHLLFNFYATYCICFIITEKIGVYRGCFCTVIINTFMYLTLYGNITYTRSAVWYEIVACILIVTSLQPLKWGRLVSGFILMLASMMTRFDSFIMILPFAALFVLVMAINTFKDKKRVLRILVELAIPLMTLMIFVKGVEYLAYNTEEWQEYHRFNVARSELLDYGMASYDDAKKDYKEIGLSENDYIMLKSWLFNDPDFYNTDRLEKIIAIRDSIDGYNKGIRINRNTIMSTFAYTYEAFTGKVGFACLWGVLLLILAFKADKKKECLWIAYSGIILIEYFYLACRDRVIVRVEFGIWLAPIIFTLFVMLYNMEIIGDEIDNYFFRARKNWLTVICACFLVILCLGEIGNAHLCYGPSHSMDEEKFIDVVRNDDNYYIMDPSSMVKAVDNDYAINASYKDYYKNIIYAGGWTCNSPIANCHLKEAGINNPFKELLKRNDMYYVDKNNTHEMLLKYLQEHYDSNTEIKFVKNIGGFDIWQYNVK